MEFTVSTGGLPVGSYRAEFTGAEPFIENTQYGPGVSLKFRVIGGECEGQEASRICSAKMSLKSNLGKFAVALKGSAIAAGESFNFDTYKGVRGMILVEETDSGGSRISTFLREQGGEV